MKNRTAALACLVMLALASACTGIDLDKTPSWFPEPDKPDGPASAQVGEQVSFQSEGHDPLDVHEWQWEFRDGVRSDWDDDDEKVSHTYTVPGTYRVRAREQCPLKLFRSGWSDSHTITIKE